MPGEPFAWKDEWDRQGLDPYPFFGVNREGPPIRLSDYPRKRRALPGRLLAFAAVLVDVVSELWQGTEFE